MFCVNGCRFSLQYESLVRLGGTQNTARVFESDPSLFRSSKQRFENSSPSIGRGEELSSFLLLQRYPFSGKEFNRVLDGEAAKNVSEYRF